MIYTLTTPLYYVNDKPHLGSTYTTVACDALARFQRLEGHEVVFVTGVDEHGQKIQRTAADQGISPIDHCNRVTASYEKAWKEWDISHDRFVRTTSARENLESFYLEILAKPGHKKTYKTSETPIKD